MRIRTLAPLLFLLTATLAAADPVVGLPGQMTSASPSPDKTTAFLVLPPVTASTTRLVSLPDKHEVRMNRFWMASLAVMAGATTADAATSWGKREGNGFLASSGGNFGAKALSLKVGLTAATIVPQLLLHRHKNLRSKFILANVAEAGAFAGAAIHNTQVRSPQ